MLRVYIINNDIGELMRLQTSKTMLLFFVVTMIFTCSGLAAKQMKLGLKLGANFSQLTGNYDLHMHSDDRSRNRFYPGFNTGLFMELPKSNYSFQLETTYRQKSLYYSQDPDLVGASWNGKARFSYLEIPILFRYNFHNKRKKYLVVGPTMNVLLDTGILDYHRGGSSSPNASYDYEACIDDYFKTITLGITAGFGSTLIVQPRYDITAEFRLNYDLTSASKQKKIVDLNTNEEWQFDGTRFFDIGFNLCFVYKCEEKK